MKFNHIENLDVNNQQIKYKAALQFGVWVSNKVENVYLTQHCDTLISLCPDLIKYHAINTKYYD